MPHSSRRALPAVGILAVLALAACGQATTPDGGGSAPSSTPAATEHADPVEFATLDPRVVVTYDGGLLTLDTGTGDVLDDVPLGGFLRVNPAGDGRHVLVSTSDGFHAYDSGLEARGHGDHFHYFAAAPRLTDVLLAADTPGHVVPHAGRTALFADGTGDVQVIDPSAIGEGAPALRTWTAPHPHHGVAVPLSDDTMVVSVGTDQGRTGAALLGADGGELAATDSCPGLHGEATAQGEAVVLGCEDGPLVLRDRTFHKVSVDDAYARSGNLAGHDESTVVLGDYKVEPDAEIERPEQVALIDTDDLSLRLVDLGASYSFRSLARGPDGAALVLTTDGSLRVIDPESGEELRRVEVVEAWEEPTAWQDPRPALRVADGVAYVSEPATSQLHAVSISGGDVVRSYDLPEVPNELAVVTGFPPAGGEHGHE